MRSILSPHKTSLLFLPNLLLVFALICVSISSAQETLEESLKTLNPKTFSIPSQGIEITSVNAQSYKSILAPEIYDITSKGLFVFSLQSKPQSKLTPTVNISGNIDKKGNFSVRETLKEGVPFDIDKETTPNEQETPYKILWNSQAAIWNSPLFVHDFILREIESNAEKWSARGSLSRIYPGRIPPATIKDQLFREKISLTSPQPFALYTWLTFRLLASDEDLVWIYSPLIKRDRQVAGSVRTDPLFHSSMSTEDILTWSGKPDGFNARLLGKDSYALPITTIINQAQKITESAQSCVTATSQEWGSPEWNFQSKKLPQSAGWISTNQTFIPRSAWRIELINRDPYSLYGKEIVYIDVQTYLPVMKAVFDRSGKLWKVIISSFAIIPSTDKPYPWTVWYKYSQIYDTQKNQATLFEITNSLICKEYTDAVTLKSFDPNQLGGETTLPELKITKSPPPSKKK